jgi:hypothetical protein
MSDNMQLWEAVRTPDPAATKAFTKSGGFKGTATNAVYLIQRATELWGPMGAKWGVEIVDDRVIEGAPLLGKDGAVIGRELLHVIRINLRHPGGSVPGYGQTMLVGANKYGPYTDEEAPKKSLTDALTKALSWLGFAADIHLGRWDDNKYVNQAKAAFSEQAPDTPSAPPAPASAKGIGMDPDELASRLQAIRATTDLDDLRAMLLSGTQEAKAAQDAEAYGAIRAAAVQRKKEIAPKVEAA